MDSLITLISELVDQLICWIETAVVLFTNYLILGIGYVIAAIIGVLPTMPSLPAMPSWFTDGYHYVAYWFPVDFALSFGGILFTLWLAWIAIALILRWTRVVGGEA